MTSESWYPPQSFNFPSLMTHNGGACDCQSQRIPQYLLNDLCVVCELQYIAITRGKIEGTREEILIPKCGSLFSFLRDEHKAA